jgi:hypothetical protein
VYYKVKNTFPTASLGEQRVRRAKQVLNKTGEAVLVIDREADRGKPEEELIRLFRVKEILFIIATKVSCLRRRRERLWPGNGRGNRPSPSARRPERIPKP